MLQSRIDLAVTEHDELLRWLTVKIDFIQAVLDDKITFKNKTRKQAGEDIMSFTSALESDTNRLLGMNILSLTKEQVTALRNEIKEAKARLKYWKNTTPTKQYVEDLNALQ
jgi:exopolysaccharide biosynthesis predicted pyruvyltransferase EpsI